MTDDIIINKAIRLHEKTEFYNGPVRVCSTKFMNNRGRRCIVLFDWRNKAVSLYRITPKGYLKREDVGYADSLFSFYEK